MTRGAVQSSGVFGRSRGTLDAREPREREVAEALPVIERRAAVAVMVRELVGDRHGVDFFRAVRRRTSSSNRHTGSPRCMTCAPPA